MTFINTRVKGIRLKQFDHRLRIRRASFVTDESQKGVNVAISSLKALFNNVFTFKNLSCKALYDISVFGKV